MLFWKFSALILLMFTEKSLNLSLFLSTTLIIGELGKSNSYFNGPELKKKNFSGIFFNRLPLFFLVVFRNLLMFLLLLLFFPLMVLLCFALSSKYVNIFWHQMQMPAKYTKAVIPHSKELSVCEWVCEKNPWTNNSNNSGKK